MSRRKGEGTDAFSLLEVIGRDCVGALRFLPENHQETPNSAEIPISDEAIKGMLEDLEVSPLGISNEEQFRISVAGAQSKTALLKKAGKWWIPGGTSATTHIIKPAIGMLKNGTDMRLSVENEFFCLKFLSNTPIKTAEAHIEDFSGKKALVVKRFDRKETPKGLIRLPQEDYCQVFGVSSNKKYETDGGPGILKILGHLRESDTGSENRVDFFFVQLLFWLLGATDGHAKNFSILLQPGGGFILSPIYDVISAQPVYDAGQITRNKMRLAMKVGDNNRDVIDRLEARHFIQTAIAAKFPENAVKDLFVRAKKNIPIFLEKTLNELPKDFPEKISQSIANGVLERLKKIEV